MIYTIDLLNNDEIKYINDVFDCSNFCDGLVSNTQFHQDLKSNKQLVGYELNILKEYLIEILNKHKDFAEITSAKSYSNILFSKYESGMYYHLHNDNYIMGNGTRTDLSCTLFLNSPDEYEGGELILNFGNQNLSYKLNAGECVIYPTGLLHEVKPVISGIRKVCVFWIESCISDIDIRSIITDLHFMYSKYYDEAFEKLGEEFCIKLQNLKFKLLRKYGNFSGVNSR